VAFFLDIAIENMGGRWCWNKIVTNSGAWFLKLIVSFRDSWSDFVVDDLTAAIVIVLGRSGLSLA
jgi:hypothetical protein